VILHGPRRWRTRTGGGPVPRSSLGPRHTWTQPKHQRAGRSPGLGSASDSERPPPALPPYARIPSDPLAGSRSRRVRVSLGQAARAKKRVGAPAAARQKGNGEASAIAPSISLSVFRSENRRQRVFETRAEVFLFPGLTRKARQNRARWPGRAARADSSKAGGSPVGKHSRTPCGQGSRGRVALPSVMARKWAGRPS